MSWGATRRFIFAGFIKGIGTMIRLTTALLTLGVGMESQRRQSLSRAGGLVVIPKRICVGFYPGERPHHPQGMLRQPIPEARTCTCHDTAPAPTEQARTAAIRRHKNPKQNTRLGFLWTRQQGCRGMGCR